MHRPPINRPPRLKPAAAHQRSAKPPIDYPKNASRCIILCLLLLATIGCTHDFDEFANQNPLAPNTEQPGSGDETAGTITDPGPGEVRPGTGTEPGQGGETEGIITDPGPGEVPPQDSDAGMPPARSDAGTGGQGDAAHMPDADQEPSPGPDAGFPPQCDPATIFENNGCLGCHGPSASGGLDLRRDDLAGLFTNARSQTQGCQDRLLVDPINPERSLLLQAVGAAPQPQGDGCDLSMPEVSPRDQICLTDWVQSIADGYDDGPSAFEGSPLHSSLQKVKTLIHGDALTQEELNTVAGAQNEEAAMRTLYRSWTAGPNFDSKMADFFEVTLQQRLQTQEFEQFNRLRTDRSVRPHALRVMEESFVRTALHLVNNDRPLTEVATTNRWMVTTANLAFLLYGDQSQADLNRRHTIFSQRQGRRTGLQQQINNRAWYLPHEVIGECEIRQSALLNFFVGDIRRRDCEGHSIPRNRHRFGIGETHLTEADYNDWRLVDFNFSANAPAEERIPFYDLIRLRRANAVVTRVPRVGFFTTNAFFENWATNVDNQFRVAVNQSLLAALHIGFNASERTAPFNDSVIDREHAAQECYGCHKNIDPMRNYFSKSYNVSYQRPFGEGDNARILGNGRPAFTFRGQRNRGGDLRRFGRMLAEHPDFAKAWVQKVCHFANSARCNESDPRFQQIVNDFRQNNFNFKTMLVNLLASPLVSKRTELATGNENDFISITRRGHLCALLSQRSGRQDICSVNRISQIIGLIPEDNFARGIIEPTQPVRPSPIFIAAAEAVCQEVARLVVRGDNAVFPVNRPAQAITSMVNRLMALSTQPERAERVHEALTAHFEAAQQTGVNRQNALRSTFIGACLSPDVMGIGL